MYMMSLLPWYTTNPYIRKTTTDHLSPKFIKREEEDKTDRILAIEMIIDHAVGTDKDKTLDLTIGDNHKADTLNMEMTVGEEAIDIKTMIIEMIVEIEGDKILGEALAMTDMTIGIGVGQDKEV